MDVPGGEFNGRWGYSTGYGDFGVAANIMDRNEVIDIDTDLIEAIEGAIESGDIEAINSALLAFASTVFHEYTHYGNQNMFAGTTDADGQWEEESGYGFEREIYGENVTSENASEIYHRKSDGDIQILPIWTQLMDSQGKQNISNNKN